MTPLSRIALALPFCAALSAPAAAQDFVVFNFSYGDFTLSGVTSAGITSGTHTFGGNVALTLSGVRADSTTFTNAPVFLYDGAVAGSLFGASPVDSSGAKFTISGTGSNVQVSWTDRWAFTVGGPYVAADTTQTPSPNTIDNGGALFHFRAGETQLRYSTWATSSGIPTLGNSATAGQTFEFNAADSSASLVPEINGSGFAYIAFILGALGLWLYSGGLQRRDDEAPVTA